MTEEIAMSDKKTYLVAGSGISGIAAAKLLVQAGEDVVLYDGNTKIVEEDLRAKLGPAAGISIVLGELPETLVEEVTACIISPGIPLRVPFVQQLKAAGVPLWSEIELAYRYGNGRIAAITGTNGKTTTTALTGEILAEAFPDTHVVGNIGIPYTEKAAMLQENSMVAAEISSFQLESIVDFHPAVTAILNITPDHLDRHGSMEEYIRVKESITANQTAEDWCVLNYEDEELRRFGQEDCVPQVVFFSSQRIMPGGLYLQEGNIISEIDGEREIVCHIEELNILGRHNYENVMAAVGICRKMGVPMEQIRHACVHFRAVEHRIEFVREVQGVTYYNDSKGTNTDAAIQAVKAMVRPTVLIGGGYDKGSEYDDWIAEFPGKVRLLILIGQTASKIAETAVRMGFDQILYADSMEEAVALASSHAVSGEAVLLSPACASWGMFKNYEERGRIFKELVNQL